MTIRNKYYLIFWSVMIAALAAGAVVWNTARQEVYYLCGNFVPGVAKPSVIRQLGTANLASYEQSTTQSGSRIVFSSNYNFGIHQCVIDLDTNNKVVSATYM